MPVRPPSPLAIVAACLLLAAAVLLFFQVRSFIGHMETKQANSDTDLRLRSIDQQMEALRGKFNGLLAESVETRLKLLQKNIDAGKVGADDLRVFAELQRDLALLETYAGAGAPTLSAAALEHPRYQAAPPAPQRVVRNDELMDEVQELKALFYGCVLAVVVGAGLLAGLAWRRQRRSAHALEAMTRRLPGLDPPPHEDQ